jgi:hypothetical protein
MGKEKEKGMDSGLAKGKGREKGRERVSVKAIRQRQ